MPRKTNTDKVLSWLDKILAEERGDTPRPKRRSYWYPEQDDVLDSVSKIFKNEEQKDEREEEG